MSAISVRNFGTSVVIRWISGVGYGRSARTVVYRSTNSEIVLLVAYKRDLSWEAAWIVRVYGSE